MKLRKLGPVRISWSWLLFTTAVIVLGVPLFTASALCLRDAECRGVHQTLLIRVDRTLFNGTLRRLHLGQRLPRLPERPFAHGADAYSYVDSVAFLGIGHGLGPQLWAGGNTLPTFRRGLEIGFRVFEVDLALTTDDHLVCYHGSDQHELSRLSYAGYLLVRQTLPTWWPLSALWRFSVAGARCPYGADVVGVDVGILDSTRRSMMPRSSPYVSTLTPSNF